MLDDLCDLVLHTLLGVAVRFRKTGWYDRVLDPAVRTNSFSVEIYSPRGFRIDFKFFTRISCDILLDTRIR